MPQVRFLPADVTVEVPEGKLVHEAAILAGLHDLELPCGGQGTCGQCLVEIEGGEAVLACQTIVRRDITVRLPETSDTAMQVVSGGVRLEVEGLSPLFRRVRVSVPPASIEEHYSDWARLTRALGFEPRTSVEVLRGLAEAVRAGEVEVELAGDWLAGVRGSSPARAEAHPTGLAIDIGTTTVAVHLVDLEDGRILGTASSFNRQLLRGADVISRIEYARTGLAELRELILETLRGLIREVGGEEARAAFVAGNTTMIHLLLGLPPRHIREAPYVPTVNPVPLLTAAEVGLPIHPEAVVACAPGVGSYVGGDITAGLLATELVSNHEDVFLFLDIGTNGEIVIGNADWLVGCACSAGPAFEGAGISCGMRASPGAIEQITLGGRYQVIGGGRPAGLCGSGLIGLLGELFQHGIIDAAGHFQDGRREFCVVPAVETAGDEDLVITEADIENLIRTKAAIYAACTRVLENVGLDWSAIARVYIAGGFGRYIRISEAVRIGMLPDLPHGRFTYLGNSALAGAYMALLSAGHRRKLAETAARMTYVDLSSDPRYLDSYVAAMFLPHTDLSLFPSLRRQS